MILDCGDLRQYRSMTSIPRLEFPIEIAVRIRCSTTNAVSIRSDRAKYRFSTAYFPAQIRGRRPSTQETDDRGRKA